MKDEATVISNAQKPFSTRLEIVGIALCAFLYFLLRLWGLRANPINGLFDEGVYLSLMQMEATGRGVTYRDVIFGHPPGVIWAGAWLWNKVGRDVYWIRFLCIAFCSLAFVPMYSIARKLYGSRIALATLFLMATSPGFANWLGCTVFLELPQNVFLYQALWLLVCTPRPRPFTQIAIGFLFAISFLVKQPCIPAAIMLTIALFAYRREPQGESHASSEVNETRTGQVSRYAWLWFGGTFLLTLTLVVYRLSHIPNYWFYFNYYYSIFKNHNDSAYQWGQHFYELSNGFYALPIPLTFGSLGVWHMWRQGKGRAERCLALYSMLIALFLFFLPRRFYWRYLMIAMPVFCLGAAVWWQRFLAKPHSKLVRSAAIAFAVLFGMVHMASLALYRTRDAVNPPEYKAALEVLRQSPSPLFTLNNLWAPVSGLPLVMWRHNGGDTLRRKQEMESDHDQLTAIIDQSPTVLLDYETMRWLPSYADLHIRTHYKTIFRYQTPTERHYVEILRRSETMAVRTNDKGTHAIDIR